MSEVSELASLIFDAIEASHSVEEVQKIHARLIETGVDATGLCRKKHPT